MNVACANELLNLLQKKLEGKMNDAALSRKLNVSPVIISKIRHGRLPLGAVMIVKINEAFGMDIAEIKCIANIPRYVGGV